MGITVTTTARGPLMLSPRSFLTLVMLVFSEVFTLVCPPPLLSPLRPQLPPSLSLTPLPLLLPTLPQSLLPTPLQLWLSTPPPSSTPPLLSSTSATRSTTRCSTCPRSLSRSPCPTTPPSTSSTTPPLSEPQLSEPPLS